MSRLNSHIYLDRNTDRKISNLTKKGQSALEYMMTYGWAILIIVIVAVILYSMGIFNPSSSISFSITGFAGFSVQANCVAGQTLIVSLYNGLGYPVQLNEVTIYFSNGSKLSEPVNYTMIADQQHDFFLQYACPGTVGSYFNDKLIFTGIEYNSLNSPISLTGSISGHISSLTPYNIIETIPVQNFPTANAITPSGFYIWQPNQANSTISIINVVSGSVVKTLSNLPTRSVVFSNNGKLAFIAGNSPVSPAGTWMVVMNTTNYKVIDNISKVCDPQTLSVTSNNLLIIPAWITPPDGFNGPNTCDNLIIINASNLKVLENVSQDGLYIWSAEQSPSGNYIYLAGYKSSNFPYLSIMSTSDYKIVKNITGNGGDTVIFSPNGDYAYSGSNKYLVTIDTSTMDVVNNKTITNTSGISGMTISNNGNYIYSAICSNNKIPVYETSLSKVIANITLPYPVNTCVSYSVLSKTNNLLYVAEVSTNPGKVFVISV